MDNGHISALSGPHPEFPGEQPEALVCLVNPPHAAIQRPSIALGMLKACLAADGIATRVLYPNLWFGEAIGLTNLSFLSTPDPENCCVDWLFAPAVFPQLLAQDDDDYVEDLLSRYPAMQGQAFAPAPARLKALRARAVAFVDQAARRILEERPAIVGCSSTFSQHLAGLAILKRIRELAPSVITMMGGANCESVMGRRTHQEFQWVDFIVSGEADEIIAPLCRLILEHGREVPAGALPLGAFGPAHRTAGYPTGGPDGTPRASTKAVADIPTPDYDEYFAELGRSSLAPHVEAALPFESSRGCWWGERSHCTFCGLNGGSMAYRSRPADRVLAELDAMASTYRIRRFEAVDNILDLKYLDSLVPALASGDRDFSIFYETKANLKRNQVAALADAGIRWIQPGIESLSTELLKLMRKGSTASQNILLLKWCRQLGLRVHWSLIIGFPGEQDDWYAAAADTVPLLHHLQPGPLGLLRYDRYSPYHQRPADFGLRLVPSPAYRHIYPLAPDAVEELAYYFRDIGPGGWAPSPGQERFRAAVEAWGAAWSEPSGVRPLCVEVARDGQRYIVDTRTCAVAMRHDLSDPEWAILAAAEDGMIRPRSWGGDGRSDDEAAALAAAFDSLVRRRLLCVVDDRILALPLKAPVIPLPAVQQYPAGSVREFDPPPAQNPAELVVG